MMPRRIYVASSWRNAIQPEIVETLRAAGHDVYDFRNPAPGQKGFAWRDCGGQAAEDGPGTGARTIPSYLEAIRSERARQGFAFDKQALDWCDTCVLVLPCGRSAHLELGYAAGQGKDTYVLLHEDKFEPELMYLLNTDICTDVQEIIDLMGDRQPNNVIHWFHANGGSGRRAAGHALRLLREAVELSVATGARLYEIEESVKAELGKAIERKEFDATQGYEAVASEWADCALLLDIFADLFVFDPVGVKRKKLDALWTRLYHPDSAGSLWRASEPTKPAITPAAAWPWPQGSAKGAPKVVYSATEPRQTGLVGVEESITILDPGPIDSDGGHPD